MLRSYRLSCLALEISTNFGMLKTANKRKSTIPATSVICVKEGTARYLKIPKKNANPSWNFRTAADAFLSDTRPDLPRVYRYARKVDFLSRLDSTPLEVDKQKLL